VISEVCKHKGLRHLARLHTNHCEILLAVHTSVSPSLVTNTAVRYAEVRSSYSSRQNEVHSVYVIGDDRYTMFTFVDSLTSPQLLCYI